MMAKFCRSCGKLSNADKGAAEDDLSKLSLLAKIAGSFLLGIYLGTLTFNAMGPYAFLIPAAGVGSVGCVCLCHRLVKHYQSKAKETKTKDLEAGKAAKAEVQADETSVVPASEKKSVEDEAANTVTSV